MITEVFERIIEAPLNLNRRHRRYNSVTECFESSDLIFRAIKKNVDLEMEGMRANLPKPSSP